MASWPWDKPGGSRCARCGKIVQRNDYTLHILRTCPAKKK